MTTQKHLDSKYRLYISQLDEQIAKAEEEINKYEREIEIRKKLISECQEIMDILGEYDRDGKRREVYKAVKKV